MLGYPLTSTMGEEIKYTTGVISSRTGYEGNLSQYQISAPVQPGNSGGPLFDDKGNVIGIVSAKHRGAENVSYAVKSSYIWNLVESYASISIMPTSNSIISLSRPEQIKRIKKSVYLVECSSNNSSYTYNPSSYPSNDNSNNIHPKNSDDNSNSKYDLELKVGETIALQAYNYDSSITWESSNTKIATVSSTGVVKGISPGTTGIWAKGKDYRLFMVTVR